MDNKEMEDTEDTVEPDFWPFKSKKPVFTIPRIVPGQHQDDELYNMSHENRGIALIFNHRHFNSLYMKERKGTEYDRDALEALLKKLKFHVEVYNDLTRLEVIERLLIVSKMDHTSNDCMVIAVLSHGTSHGRIYAKDYDYTVHELVGYLSGDKCPSLAGKPKLFFIQACRGEKVDSGISVRVETDNINRNEIVYSIPVMADILIMFATVEGYYAWRDTTKGSWFIQTLVKKLEEHHERRDLVSILTLVNREVAFGFESNSLKEDFHQKKEMTSIVSMLTRFLYFR